MGNKVVIYKSKYGSTKKYATWIAERLNAEVFEEGEVKEEKLSEYKTIIYGGGLYAGGILGSSILSKNYDQIKDSNIVVFTVGLAATDDKSIFDSIIEKNFPGEMKNNIKFFHLRGGIDYGNLSFIHKGMMAMMKKSVEKKENKTEEDELMIKTYGDKIDFSDITTIGPLVDYVNNLI